MTIDFAIATPTEVLAEYKVGIAGLTEVLGVITEAIAIGATPADDPEAGVALAAGFRNAIEFVQSLGDNPDAPDDLVARLSEGVAGEVLEAGRLVADLHDQAVAAGRVSTPRSLGIAIGMLGIEVTRADAANGNEEAKAALVKAEAEGLL